MDGLEQKVLQVKPINNHHFSFNFKWAQPCTVWVQVHNEFKHRSSFKIRQSPRRTHQSTILVVPDREAYFSWVRAGSVSVSPSSAPPPPSSSNRGGPPVSPTASSSSENHPHCLSGKPISHQLHLAAAYGDADRLRRFLKVDLDLALASDALGRSMLHYAALFGVVDTFLAILEQLPHSVRLQALRQQDCVGLTCLHYAVLNPSLRASHEMLFIAQRWEPDLHNPYVSPATGFAPVHAAILRRRADILPTLLHQVRASRASLARPVFDGWSVFHLASIADFSAAIHTLLPFSAIDSRDFNGETALFLAARSKNMALMSQLLHAGASVRVSNAIRERIFDVASPDSFRMLVSFSQCPNLIRIPQISYSSLSDQRARMVAAAILHANKKLAGEPTGRPNSADRRRKNLSAPASHFAEYVDPAGSHEILPMPGEVDHLLETPVIPEPCIDRHDPRRRGSESSVRLRSRNAMSSTFSADAHHSASSASCSNGDGSSSPDIQIAPIPSLFGLLALSPRRKRASAPSPDKGLDKPKSNPFAKLFSSRSRSKQHAAASTPPASPTP